MNFALKLDTNGNVSRIPFTPYNYAWYAKQIGCEWIENVYPRDYKDYVLVIDEEGLLNKKKVNPYASLMYGILEHGQPIVGDALLLKMGITEDGPDLVGFSEIEAIGAMMMLSELRNKVVIE